MEVRRVSDEGAGASGSMLAHAASPDRWVVGTRYRTSWPGASMGRPAADATRDGALPPLAGGSHTDPAATSLQK